MIPLVTVVIPTFNHSEFLKAAIETVLGQSEQSFEIIIIDNFSTDDTEKIVHSFRDKRLRYFKFSNCGVIGKSRNFGIKKSRGKFIAFLDSDDLWAEHKLEYCIKLLSNCCDAVCHPLDEFPSQNLPSFRKHRSSHKIKRSKLLFDGNYISTSSVVVKKSVFFGNNYFSEDKRHVTAEDFFLWIKLLDENMDFRFENRILGFYRVHSSNNSSNVEKNFQAAQSVVSDIIGTKQYVCSDVLRLKAISTLKANIAIDSIKKGKLKVGLLWLFRSFMTFPILKKFVIAFMALSYRVILGK